MVHRSREMDILHLDLNQCYTNSLICDTPFALSRLLWLVQQKDRDMLRSLTAGLVCRCLIDTSMSD